MIYLKVRGRLGNQFFQYGAVKSYQIKYCPNEEIVLDFSDLKRLGNAKDGFVDSLGDFKVGKYKTVDKIEVNFIQKIFLFLMRIPNPLFRLIGLSRYADILSYKIEYFMQPLLNKVGIFYMIHGFYPMKEMNTKNKIFIGNFESPKYLDEQKKDIVEMFTPKHKPLSKNKDMYEKIKNNNSICITIRRGDFVSNDDFKKVHYVCDSTYCYKASELMKEKIDNPLFVVFSDDIEWVKENMDFGASAIYEDGTDPLYEKIRLMSSCKHFIISNSTFSWWVQYLSTNKKKIVIAPKKWKNIAYKKDTGKLDIYEDFWILL